jgi:redox-sensitive bicupin YhaK (pirin superfamily)
MLQIIKKDEVYVSEHGWLTSRFLFSFAEYFDEQNLSFGHVRVFNDDHIAGRSGFPPHSHKEMEIVTIIHSGTLTHTDSMGNKRTLSKGFVQRMSAGSGVIHSEMNEGDEEVHLYQMWFFPQEKGVMPSYEEKFFEKKGALTLLVSPDGREGSVSIGAQVLISLHEMKVGEKFVVEEKSGSYVFFYIKEGELRGKSGGRFCEGDQLRIINEGELEFVAETYTQFVMIVSESA